MLFDKQNIFSDSQKITSTCYSTQTIFFGKNDVSYLPFRAQVVESFVGATSLTMEIQTAETSSFADYDTIYQGYLDIAQLEAGNVFPIFHLPYGNKGYMRLKLDVTGSPTKGRLTAGIVAGNDISWQV